MQTRRAWNITARVLVAGDGTLQQKTIREIVDVERIDTAIKLMLDSINCGPVEAIDVRPIYLLHSNHPN